MRGLPIFTFINKLDRNGRDPLDLLDELEKVLGIRSCPMSWPIGMGDQFRGVYDRQSNQVLLFEKSGEANAKKKLESIRVSSMDEPEFKEALELLELAGDSFDQERVLRGDLSPVFFGSAMNNFGVEHFLDRFIEIAPPPVARVSDKGEISAYSSDFSGFIFKVQANMNPMHRDRVAFMRVCSGKFLRGMGVHHSRLKKEFKLNKPFHLFAQEREIIEEAFPGDIVGLIDTTGELRIGDTLSAGSQVTYQGVPSFSPEFFATLVCVDPLKRKQFQKGLDQLREEGVAQVFRQKYIGDQAPILGVVGVLQFEIFQYRLKSEYGVEVRIDRLPFTHLRWADGAEGEFEKISERSDVKRIEDRDGRTVFLFQTDWALDWISKNHKDVKFFKTN
jgi:peptide chain release factor 3